MGQRKNGYWSMLDRTGVNVGLDRVQCCIGQGSMWDWTGFNVGVSVGLDRGECGIGQGPISFGQGSMWDWTGVNVGLDRGQCGIG